MKNQRTISFRLDEDKLKALDGLAETVDRDRTYLLNEAVSNYLELQAYHQSLIKEGLKAVKEGRTIETSEVRARISKLARSRRAVR
jgi:predicted transcriptional regulator